MIVIVAVGVVVNIMSRTTTLSRMMMMVVVMVMVMMTRLFVSFSRNASSNTTPTPTPTTCCCCCCCRSSHSVSTRRLHARLLLHRRQINNASVASGLLRAKTDSQELTRDLTSTATATAALLVVSNQGSRRAAATEPGDLGDAVDEAQRRIVGGREVGVAAGRRQERQDLLDLVLLVVGGLAELGVGEQRVQDPEVGVAQGHELVGQVEEVADDDVEEDPQVVRVEVLVRGPRREEEVEQLEDQELQRRLRLPVQEQDDVLAERPVEGPVEAEALDHPVRERCARRVRVVGRGRG